VDVVVLQKEEVVVVARERSSGTTDAPAAARVDHSHDTYTLANIITVLRLMLVPIFFSVLLTGRHDVLAFTLFALAASTDWLDGQIARRTGTVTEVGKAIDPLVDRLLIASGVLGLYIEGRIPWWVLGVLVLRDVHLLGGSAYLARRRLPRPPVVYAGKVTTAVLLVGFAGMIVNQPMMPGLSVLGSEIVPGLGPKPVAVWILPIYAGVALSVLTAVFYTARALQAAHAAREGVNA
jgi:cardiolipin synthase